MNGFLTLQEVAKTLKLHQCTIRRYIKSGKLKAFKIGDKGMWRIRQEDLMRLINGGVGSGKDAEASKQVPSARREQSTRA